MHNPLGIYIHVPFCKSKCGYCDFYSLCKADTFGYAQKINQQLKIWGGRITRPIDTLYFGGGTPTLLGDGIAEMINTAKSSFNFENAEITVEANPADELDVFFASVIKAGANRLSIGVQSAIDDELKILGRRHSFADAIATVKAARTAGFDNISIDLMLGIPNQTLDSLNATLQSFFELNVEHISAYMLKIEKNTPFYEKKEFLNLPDEDLTADLYIMACETLERNGYLQYEISNFSRQGKQSRHNLKYWNCDEYLGLGPAAHSFMDGKRYYFEPDINSFISNPSMIYDGQGGSAQEYAMLRLRLSDGLDFNLFKKRYGRMPSDKFINKAKKYAAQGFVECNDNAVRITKKGFLVSNTIIGGLYENI